MMSMEELHAQLNRAIDIADHLEALEHDRDRERAHKRADDCLLALLKLVKPTDNHPLAHQVDRALTAWLTGSTNWWYA